jgi:hypothetical protein
MLQFEGDLKEFSLYRTQVCGFGRRRGIIAAM